MEPNGLIAVSLVILGVVLLPALGLVAFGWARARISGEAGHLRQRLTWAALGLGLLAAVLFAFDAIVWLNYLALGERGALLLNLAYHSALPLIFFLFLARKWWRALQTCRGGTLAVNAAGTLLIGALAVHAGYLGVLDAVDLVLPIESVDADVTRWWFDGRGTRPGTQHIVTADGHDWRMPHFAFYSGSRAPGRYRLRVTSYTRTVVDATGMGAP